MDLPGKQIALGKDGPQNGQEEERKHHEGSFREYMDHKNSKLYAQFEANAAALCQSTLFNGVSIHVNGHTLPTHAELKHLMAIHGGRFENYYHRSTVTHIICSNLPDAKLKQFDRERSPTPVVQPEWITQSIAAGKLLPIENFILWQLKPGQGQRTLHAALGPQALAQAPPPQLPSRALEPAAAAAAALPMPILPPPQVSAGFPSHATTDASHPNLAYDAAQLAAAQEVAAKMRAECDVLKGPPKSSRDDPNFVESYYRASRLHFIGRWKARLEALMASSTAAGEAPPPAPFVFGGRRTILHLDMDCFFASVAEAGHPEFKGKPLAVCHSNSERGSGEVSSANYEARKCGVSASMFMSRAKELCPGLIVVPYEFEKYEKVSEQVYRILLKYTSAVQPISCDEAFLDITGLGDPESMAAAIRAEIVATTGCTASAGIGPNMLLARIATKKAKPNGQFLLTAAAALPFLAELKVEELPGVGWSTQYKLADAGITTVRELQAASKSKLQAELGNSAGAVLWDFAHGRDTRRVEPPKPRQSIGAEVNWGVRFETAEDPEKFLGNLAVEIAGRMRQAGVRGRTITLKLKRKKPGWTEPVKFLGCGACDSLSKSVTLASGTAVAEDLSRESVVLLRALRVPFDDIRGIGITVTKLYSDGSAANALAPGRIMRQVQSPGHATITGGVGNGASPPAAVQPAGGQVSPKPLPAPGAVGLGTFIDKDGVVVSEDSDAGWETSSDPDHELKPMLPMKQPLAKSLVNDKAALPLAVGKVQGGEDIISISVLPKGDVGGVAAVLGSEKGPQRKKEKSPKGGKQVSLIEMMPPPPPRSRHSMDEVLHDEDEVDAVPSGRKSVRQELMARYECMSLTQIDAAELSALPWQVQKELIGKLPRTRKRVAGKEVSKLIDSDIRAGNSAGKVPAHAEKLLGQEQDRTENPENAAEGRVGAPVGEHAEDGTKIDKGPIKALPALSELDPTVLDALPLNLRREIEAAYGIKKRMRGIESSSTSAAAGTGAGPSGTISHRSGPGRGKAISSTFLPSSSRSSSRFGVKPGTSKVRRIDAFVVHKSEPMPTPVAGKSRRRPGNNNGAAQITLSQIDPGVLNELPQELQNELLGQLRPPPKKLKRSEKVAVAARAAVEEAVQQRQALEDLQAAQVAGSSDEDEDLEIFDPGDESVPLGVQSLLEIEAAGGGGDDFAAGGTGPSINGGRVVLDDIDAMLRALNTAVQELAQGSDVPASTNNDLLERAVSAVILRIGQYYIARNLEGAKRVLLRIQDLGALYPCFASCAETLVAKLQRRVKRRYGWPLALRAPTTI